MSNQTTGEFMQSIKARPPAVHCLANTVVQARTANMLLAAGTHPSMSSDILEIADFVGNADALLINPGTLDDARKQAIETALYRLPTQWAFPGCLTLFWWTGRLRDWPVPAISLIGALLLFEGIQVKFPAVMQIRRTSRGRPSATVAVTGATDLVTNGTLDITLEGGHPLMGRVTGIGCAGTAVIAAFCAIAPTGQRFNAVVEALRTLATAGERPLLEFVPVSEQFDY